MRKPTIWFPNKSHTIRSVQLKKTASSLKFRRRGIVLSVKRKQRRRSVTAKLICVFVFAYANCWFSHEAAQIKHDAYICTCNDLGQEKKLSVLFAWFVFTHQPTAMSGRCLHFPLVFYTL